MQPDHDSMMMVRADLCARLERLQRLAGRHRPAEFAPSVAALRQTAAAYGMIQVVRLAEAMQRSIAENGWSRTGSRPAALYLDRLGDAIGCGRDDEQAGEAMIASVNVRFTA
jgi:hypothetical protein